MLKELDRKFEKYSRIQIKILKTVVLSVGVFYIFIMVLGSQDVYYTSVTCTKSMYPYMDCPCLVFMKDFDSYGYNVNTMTPTASINETIAENMKLIESDDYVNGYIQNNTRIGDVITFRNPYGRGYVMHRAIDKCYYQEMVEENGTFKIINLTQRGFYLKGDNSNSSECIDFRDIISKLVMKFC